MAVLPSEIEQLPEQQGYLKFAQLASPLCYRFVAALTVAKCWRRF